MEILVSKMDQNLVYVPKPAKATKLAPRLLDQADGHPPLSIDTFSEEGLLSPCPSFPSWERGRQNVGKIHLKRWTEPKHRGLKAPVSHVLPTVWLFTADMGHNAQGTD